MFGFIEDDRRTAEISDIGVGRWFYSSCSDRSERTSHFANDVNRDRLGCLIIWT